MCKEFIMTFCFTDCSIKIQAVSRVSTYYREGKTRILLVPLHTLTEKRHTFVWTDECETAFRTLKKALVSSPILAFPEEKGQNFILDCDVSNVAAGSMLLRYKMEKKR